MTFIGGSQTGVHAPLLVHKYSQLLVMIFFYKQYRSTLLNLYFGHS